MRENARKIRLTIQRIHPHHQALSGNGGAAIRDRGLRKNPNNHIVHTLKGLTTLTENIMIGKHRLANGDIILMGDWNQNDMRIQKICFR